jgi:putative colanic acid biosynthesis UDP-glucose lipid carrier transferase
MKGIFNRYLIAKVVLDFPVLITAYLCAFFMVEKSTDSIPLSVHLVFVTTSVFSWYLAARISRLNTERRFNKYAEEIVFICYTILLFAFIQGANIFFFQLFLYYNSSIFYDYLAILFGLLFLVKYIVRKYLHLITNKGKLFERVIIVSESVYAEHFFEILSRNAFYGYKCLGALYDGPDGFDVCPYLGKTDNVESIIKEMDLDEVVIALPQKKEKEINRIITVCNQHRVNVRIIPNYIHLTTSPITIENIGLIPVISQQALPLDEWGNQLIKRVFDIVFSLLFFILIASWLFPILILLVKITSAGPVFFKQKRWGLNNSHINVYKFRTMYNQVPTSNGDGKFLQTERDDVRVTPLGRFMRKTSLDELPQFLNSLRGDMSVVGPRPHPIPHNLEFLNAVSSYNLRHLIKPGITGWAQVNGFRGITKTNLDMQNRVNYDLYYIRKWNFWLDCQIVLQTIINLLKGEDQAY